MNWLDNWLYRDAKWYQFWLPQSGPVGGAISGAIVSIAMLLVMTLIIG